MESFSTSEYEPRRRLNVWKDILSEVYFRLQVEGAEEGLLGEIKQVDFGSVSITSYNSDHQRNVRTKQCIAADSDDSFAFLMPVKGAIEFQQNARLGTIAPGGYVLLSSSDFYEIRCLDNYANLTVKIPGTELRRRLPNADDYCASKFPPNAELAQLVRNHIDGLLRLSFDESQHRQSLASILIDLISLTLGASHTDTESASQYALRRRVQVYISDNLANPELTPRKIAEDNGISLSYLYKIFHSMGQPVSEYILDQRLQLAYEALTQPHAIKSTVAEIAYSSGFKSVPHFSRVFAEKFNLSPGRLRLPR